jgi:hypothetical protein
MMVNALKAGGLKVQASDFASGEDFLTSTPSVALDAIVTNPPYTLARQFIERALLLIRPRGLVANRASASRASPRICWRG